MAANLACTECGGETIRGEIRGGNFDAGAFFLSHEGDKKTFTGAPKISPAQFQQDNRVVSFACTRCGVVTSFLERAVRE